MSKALAASLIMFVLFAQGCAMFEAKPPEEVVAAKSQARLDALVAGDFAKAYSFASPTYRKSIPLGSHQKKFAGATAWTDAKVDQVECDVDVCEVRTLVTYRMAQFDVTSTRPFFEKWINIDGKWWIYHK